MKLSLKDALLIWTIVMFPIGFVLWLIEPILASLAQAWYIGLIMGADTK